jgi:hypothetical protein
LSRGIDVEIEKMRGADYTEMETVELGYGRGSAVGCDFEKVEEVMVEEIYVVLADLLTDDLENSRSCSEIHHSERHDGTATVGED